MASFARFIDDAQTDPPLHLRNIETFDRQRLEFGRFNVIVGPNNIGKTTFLQELYSCGTKPVREDRRHYVQLATFDDAVQPPTARLLLDSMDAQPLSLPGTFEYIFRIRRPQAPGEIKIFEATKEALEKIAKNEQATIPSSVNELRHLLWVYHSPGQRLSDVYTANIANAQAPWPDALNVLHDDPAKLRTLQSQYFEDYGIQLILRDETGTNLLLGTADPGEPFPTFSGQRRKEHAQAVKNWSAQHNFAHLRDAGDGMKAKTKLMLSLFEPLDHVLFIDEPELHLYQRQRYLLGRRLVELSDQNHKQVFVVTHDPTFLQGALEATSKDSDVRLIRMGEGADRKHRKFTIKALTVATMSAPRRQAEALDAVFREGVVLVEGPEDRAFYEEARSILRIASNSDIGFLSCWGVDRMDAVARYCKEIGIPFQCIVDFDWLLPQRNDPTRLKNRRKIKPHGPFVETLCKTMGVIVPNDFPRLIVRALTDVQNADPTRNSERLIKDLGLETPGLSSAVQAGLRSLLETLAAGGIHVVPYGTVRSWCREATTDGWVEDATERLSSTPSLQQRIQPFLEVSLRRLALGGLEKSTRARASQASKSVGPSNGKVTAGPIDPSTAKPKEG